ncbi:uncharacterized protein A4U43_C01F20750 [Asparagus officinalis]|uniref:Uncharacterized protein n=1 Tax=Asparagus officinalis TaxID=4686 RepID=A0A5P1FQX1_ASPOF|nr:uncharacterized protein A4U43_C01F20750 [Asparagus officinalis]
MVARNLTGVSLKEEEGKGLEGKVWGVIGASVASSADGVGVERGRREGLRGTEAYEKPSMLNEAYEQELISLGVDMKAIKVDIEKKVAEQKQEREKKDEEPQKEIERKDEAEKEDD